MKPEGWHGQRNSKVVSSLAGDGNGLYIGDSAGQLWPMDSQEDGKKGVCWRLRRGKVTCAEVNIAGGIW